MDISEYDTARFEKETFIRFRKSLKKLGVDEYYRCFGTACADTKIKKVLMSIKERTFFDGHIVQYKCIVDKESFAHVLANTVFTMFRILCSISTEFDVSSDMRTLAGVVNDVQRGTSALERLVHVMNVICTIAAHNEIFSIVENITHLERYMDTKFDVESPDYESDEA
jgi:hypothetical protein